jgi:hypothetical protein
MTPRERFWCDRCKAYFCPNCIPATRKCPNCQKATVSLESELWRKMGKFVAAILVIIVVMVGGIGAAVYSSAGPGEVTDIADAQPGQEVRLYGVINSTNVPAFTVVKSGDDWTLGTSDMFLLVNPHDPQDNIIVDVSKCRDLDSTYRYKSGDTTGSYLDGDRITVVGKVIRNETGERVLVASTVRDGFSEPTSPWVFVFAFGMTALLLGGMVYQSRWKDLRKRREQHERFMKAKAAGIWTEKPAEKEKTSPKYEYTDRGPVMHTLGEPLIAAWEPHSLYMSRRRNNTIGYVVMAAVSIALISYWAIFLGASTESGPFFVLIIGGALIAGIVMWHFMSGFMMMAMPSEFAFTPQGAYFRYASKKSMVIRVESVAWDDIKDIPNAEEALAAPGNTRHYTVIKVGETESWLDLGKDVQKRFIEEWRRERPASDVRKEELEERTTEEIERARKETVEKAKIEWMEIPVKKGSSLFMKWFMPAMLVFVAGVFLYFAYMTRSLFVLALAIILPLAIGVPMWLFDRFISGMKIRHVTATGFSAEGLHFRYSEGKVKKDEPDFIPWTNIERVSVPNSALFQVFPVEKDKNLSFPGELGYYSFGLDTATVQMIANGMDQRYERTHPECAPSRNVAAPAETFENAAYNKARNRALLPFIGLVTGIALGVGLSFLNHFLALTVGTVVSLISFLSIVQVAPVNYRRWKAAPERVGLSPDGIHLYFGKRPVPPGTVGFLSWASLDRFSRRSDEDKLNDGLGFEDEVKSPVLIATKKSGTTWYLGPLDAPLSERIQILAPRQ